MPRKPSSRNGHFPGKSSEAVHKTNESERPTEQRKPSQNSNRSTSQSRFAKLKDNQHRPADKKSRNSNVRPTNPNGQADIFFNSNREKSPIPDQRAEELNQVILSAAPPEDAAFAAAEESGSAGTGETGGPNSVQKSSEKSRRASKIEQKTAQQALKNKFGQYDTIIQEIEREFQNQPKGVVQSILEAQKLGVVSR